MLRSRPVAPHVGNPARVRAPAAAVEGAAIQTIPLIRTSSVRPALDHLDRIGVRSTRALERARSLLHDPLRLIPSSHAGFLLAEAQDAAALDDFGLRVGEATRIFELGEWSTLFRQAVTVAGLIRGAATVAATRFNSGQRFWITQRGGDARLHARLTPRVTQGRAVMQHIQLMLALDAIRLAAGPTWRPREIHLEGPRPACADELAGHATKRILFEQPCTVLVFPIEVLGRRYPRFASPPSLVAGPVPAPEFENACRQVIETLLKLGKAELPAAAELTQMSERTLQRGLAARGYTFKRLVESVRFEAAARMLDDPGTKIVEVAAELGYTDSANFTRAFRRWAGVAPSAFRNCAESRVSIRE